jgi:hypothetical protein
MYYSWYPGLVLLLLSRPCTIIVTQALGLAKVVGEEAHAYTFLHINIWYQGSFKIPHRAHVYLAIYSYCLKIVHRYYNHSLL